VSGSSPPTLITSLATLVPSSSSSNRPSNYYDDSDNQGLVPWRLRRLGSPAGPKFVRPHWWRSLVMIRFLEMQGPNCRETLHHPLPKATLVCKKKRSRKTPKEKAHLHQSTKSFLFPLWKHYWTDCCWPVCDEFRLMWECEASDNMNTTIHMLTTITIILELSGRGAGRWCERCGGWNKTRRHRNILLHAGLATAGDVGKHEWWPQLLARLVV